MENSSSMVNSAGKPFASDSGRNETPPLVTDKSKDGSTNIDDNSRDGKKKDVISVGESSDADEKPASTEKQPELDEKGGENFEIDDKNVEKCSLTELAPVATKTIDSTKADCNAAKNKKKDMFSFFKVDTSKSKRHSDQSEKENDKVFEQIRETPKGSKQSSTIETNVQDTTNTDVQNGVTTPSLSSDDAAVSPEVDMQTFSTKILVVNDEQSLNNHVDHGGVELSPTEATTVKSPPEDEVVNVADARDQKDDDKNTTTEESVLASQDKSISDVSLKVVEKGDTSAESITIQNGESTEPETPVCNGVLLDTNENNHTFTKTDGTGDRSIQHSKKRKNVEEDHETVDENSSTKRKNKRVKNSPNLKNRLLNLSVN